MSRNRDGDSGDDRRVMTPRKKKETIVIRTLYQCYVRDSFAAIDAYRAAFGAKVTAQTLSPEGVNVHTELDLGGQILALSELPPGAEPVAGTTMEIGLHYRKDEQPLIFRAFETLKEGATVMSPPGPVFYGELMTEFVDRFGVRWCLFA
jgi:PhnB protein